MRIPAADLLGEEGAGLLHLLQNLPQERCPSPSGAPPGAATAVETTVEYRKARTAFGRPIGAFQTLMG